MTNPAPRPALRKAPDADVHPARATSAIDLRSPQSAIVQLPDSTPPAPAQPTTTARLTSAPTVGTESTTNTNGHRHTRISGSRSRHSQRPASPALPASTGPEAPGLSEQGSDSSGRGASGRGASGKKAKGKQKKRKRDAKDGEVLSKKKRAKLTEKKAKKRSERRLDLRIAVPRATRKSLRKANKARGTLVADSVESVVNEWHKGVPAETPR